MLNKNLFIGFIVIVTQLLLSTNFGQCAENIMSSPNHSESAEEVTSKLIQCLKNDNFECAVNLFHLPPSYNTDELNEDLIGIKSSLLLLRNEFGVIKQMQAIKSPEYYYNVAIEGGDVAYWQLHPLSIKTEYDVYFTNEGEGVISVDACKVISFWEIRKLSYGLKVDSPNSKDRIFYISDKMLSLMNKLHNEGRAKKPGSI